MSDLHESGVAASSTSGDVLTTIDDPDFPGEKVAAWQTPASGSAHVIQDEGTPLTARANLDFVGAGVTVTDDGVDTTTVTIGAGSYTDEQARDAVGSALVEGSGIDITVDDAGDTITIGRGALTVNAQTGTSYTLVLTDAGKFVTMTNASASTLTVPANASVAYPTGTLIEGAQLGAGQVTLTPDTGVTINATPGLKVAAQYGTFGLLKVAADTWLAFGRLSA